MNKSIAIAKLALMSLMICFSIVYTVVNHTSSANRVQALPQPYYLGEGIQYFPTGPKFRLSKEAAGVKAYRDEQNELQQTSYETTIEPELTSVTE